MKNTIKLIVFFTILLGSFFIISNLSNAATPVTDEGSLNSAVQSANSGDTIEIQNDITITKPIVIQKELTIDGKGHNLVGSPDWTSTSGNQTMFTAQFSAGKLTLKNINLKNGPKYGVQSYDGATVILDNVFITGFKYGGVLANGGNVEVRNLHLGNNGTGANNGIEIDKGASATNNPSLTMNGVLITDSNENVVRPAENGHLTDFIITNTENTTNKVVIAGGNVVLTDKNDNVISETEIPDNAKPNIDTKKVIVTLVVNDKSYKIAVDEGETITTSLLESHIELESGYEIKGYYSDSAYTKEFDFTTPISNETTIFVKIGQLEEMPEEPENNENDTENVVESTKKDETPKTGVESYLGIAMLVILFSAVTIAALKKKNIRG